MPKHSPAPWYQGRDINGMMIICQEYDGRCNYVDENPEYQANCRLVDAAPEMLLALQTIASKTLHRGTAMLHEEEMILVTQAIAKATGDQP